MINVRTLALLAAALGAAGFTAYFANSWILAERAALERRPPVIEEAPMAPVVEVLVADTEIVTGTFLTPEHLRWQPWPEDGLSDEFVVRGEGDEDETESAPEAAFEGAVAREHLVAGEPITAARVVHPGERGFLAAVLEPGLRAVSVPIDATTGISGFVFPGDWIDLILTIRMSVKDPETDEAETRYFSETLLERIRVLAVDQHVENVDGAARVAKTATLEVTTKQAEKVAIALEMGTLSLSLHSLSAEDQVPVETVLPALHPAAASGLAPASGRGPRPITPEGVNGARVGERAAKRRSYTLDMDVYYMLGDPRGLPMPGGLGRTVNVLHGSEAKEERF